MIVSAALTLTPAGLFVRAHGMLSERDGAARTSSPLERLLVHPQRRCDGLIRYAAHVLGE